MARRRKPKGKEVRTNDTIGGVTLPGERRAEIVREADPDGRPVTHHRTVDTLGRMLRAETITPSMHDAARDFQARFTIAALDNVRTTSLVRISGGGHAADLTDRQVAARENVHRVMAALGGLNSPAGSCVWYVVGLQYSIREWAARRGWGGRPVGHSQAQGILVAGLGLLAAHYGYKTAHRILGA
jgi:hypothetical protein